MRVRPILILGLIVFGCVGWLRGQEVVSGIFGFYKLDLLGNSDTIVSIPFARLEADSALVSSTNAGNVIQVQGSPNWTVNQFVYSQGVQSNAFYVRFKSGALEGRQFDITANGTNTLTVNLAGGTLAGVLTNDQISIVPHWTYATVFAGGNGIHPTTSVLSRKTEVFAANVSGIGKNLGPSATYYYFSNTTDSSTSWRTTTTGTTNRNDDIIPPNTYLTIRHNISTNTTFISLGDVILTKVAIPLRVNLTNQQDNPLGLVRPVPVTLNDSGLISNGVFTMTVSVLSRKDELYVFDNTTTNKNKSPAGTYYYLTNAGWRKTTGSASIDYGTSNILVPGAGFYIRKAATSNTAPQWINSPTY